MLTPGKRLILCLDGTWVNSDQGYNRPTLDQPNATLQIPTNVTRVYRALKKRDSAGWAQVMYYHPGVGTSGGITDTVAGGVFGAGVSEVGEHWHWNVAFMSRKSVSDLLQNIREAYSFVATNYEPGDEIILLGFSRGAFTARSVAVSMSLEVIALYAHVFRVLSPRLASSLLREWSFSTRSSKIQRT